MPPTLLRSGVYLLDPSSQIHRLRGYSYTNRMNAGIEWSCNLPYAIDVTGWDELAAWYMVFADPLGGAAFTSSPLALSHGDSAQGAGGKRAELAGIDLMGAKLNTHGLALPSKIDIDSLELAAYVCNAVGVALIWNGAANRCFFQVYHIQGDSLGSHMARVLRDTGNIWRAHNDYIEVLPGGWNSETPARPLDIQDSHETGDRDRYISQLFLVKSSQLRGQYIFDATSAGLKQGDITTGLIGVSAINTGPPLPWPYNQPPPLPGAAPIEGPQTGTIEYAAFYDQPAAGGNLCAFASWNPSFTATPTSGLPARSVVYSVAAPTSGGNPSVRLIVSGTPPDPYTNTAPAHTYDYPSGSWSGTVPYPSTQPSGRVRRHVIESPLWQTQSFMQGIAPTLLDEMQKGVHGARRTCRLDPWATYLLPGYIVPADADAPAARMDTVEVSEDQDGPRMTLTGWVM